MERAQAQRKASLLRSARIGESNHGTRWDVRDSGDSIFTVADGDVLFIRFVAGRFNRHRSPLVVLSAGGGLGMNERYVWKG